MSTEEVAAERLQAYLRELKPEAQTLLIAELERGALRGSELPGANLILQALRPVLRDVPDAASRTCDPARLFFQPLEPFLVDVESARPKSERIERASLERIWGWLRNDAMPSQGVAFVEQVSAALAANDDVAVSQRTGAFQDEAASVIDAWLARAGADERIARRLGVQVGTPRALDELTILCRALRYRGQLAELSARLPPAIRALGGDQVDNITRLLRQNFGGRPDALALAIVLVLGRLSTFWHLIRLAIRAAECDGVARVASSSLAVAVDIVLAEFERRITELRKRLGAGDFPHAITTLRDLHDASRALRTELDLSGDSSWGRELARLRAEVSGLLHGEIESLVGQVRRLLRPYSLKEIDGSRDLNADAVTDVSGRIELAEACRKYAGELAVNQIAPRVVSDLRNYLDSTIPTLLDGLRGAGAAERGFRQSQVNAAVRFAGKLHGAEYAALLNKAAVAAASDRVAAKA